ncbi:DUF2306 domain-containing protein [Maricaulis sp.]|uniref:DUF2306 domain-containing protein n=1 Tax=Maricaulis sp. TaxID=1486257 RepID=UPI0026135375|nr:DUF2306 domain-containing protein [Maricaulis sp.]
MSDTIARSAPLPPIALAQRLLKGAGALWFLVVVAGQWLFVYYILAAYVPRTVSGAWERWDETGLIHGFTEGDLPGNLGFISHVLLAAVVTLGGTLQLIPQLRQRLPVLHRWMGRTFLAVSVFMAVGGIVLIWGRGTRLNDVTGLATTIDGILILVAAAFALHFIRRRQIDRHRRWAMRLFIFVSGVWYLRVGYMAWGIATGGAGIGERMDGPADYALAYACFLLPWAILELYLRACDCRALTVKLGMAGVMLAAAVVTALGVFGAWLVMWSPHV